VRLLHEVKASGKVRVVWPCLRLLLHGALPGWMLSQNFVPVRKELTNTV
jgi:hypothetical protein